MIKKTLNTPSARLAYRESTGGNATVILVHGNSMSSRVFAPQLEGRLGRTYHLLAPDLPGHGDSGAFRGFEDYHLPAYARTLAEFCRILQLDNPVLLGWSMGGHVALEATTVIPDLRGIGIWGTPPLGFPPDMDRAFLPNPYLACGFNPQLDTAQARLWADSFFVPGTSAPDCFVQDILASDPRARKGLGASIRPGGYTDELEICKNLRLPLMVIQGLQEGFVNPGWLEALEAPSLWRGAVQTLKHCGHAAHWEEPRGFNSLVEAFLEDLA